MTGVQTCALPIYVAKDRMLSLVNKYGLSTVKQASDILIQQSEEMLRNRLRELPDGTWQSRQYFEVKGEIYKIFLTMTKSSDELIFDFTGSSPQSRFSVNCTKWASLGGLFAPLFPLLCYDITWNEGVIKPIKVIAPEGSIVNCNKPSPVSVATVGAIQSVNNAACSTIAKMLATSDKYFDQTSAVWHANHFAIFMFGKNQRGGESIGILTETFAGAGGAKTFGIIPAKLFNIEFVDSQATETIEVANMRERKGMIEAMSDAFIALPGGIGTLEEFFEIWVGRYLGFHNKPIAVIDPFGAYAPMRTALDHLAELKFMKPGQTQLIHWTTDVEDALNSFGEPVEGSL